MSDSTETIRRAECQQINADAGSREHLEAEYGTVWTTREMQQDFEVLGFSAPYCIVKRRSDGVRGSIKFQHDPRFYFSFEAEWSLVRQGRQGRRPTPVMETSPRRQ